MRAPGKLEKASTLTQMSISRCTSSVPCFVSNAFLQNPTLDHNVLNSPSPNKGSSQVLFEYCSARDSEAHAESLASHFNVLTSLGILQAGKSLLQAYPQAQGRDSDLLVANEIAAHSSLQLLPGAGPSPGSVNIAQLLGTMDKPSGGQVGIPALLTTQWHKDRE